MRRRLVRALWRVLLRLEPRIGCCAQGDHHDGIVVTLGVLQYECADCGRHEELGPIFFGASNKRRHMREGT